MKKTLVRRAGLLTALGMVTALIVVACGGGDPTPTPRPQPTATTPPQPTATTAAAPPTATSPAGATTAPRATATTAPRATTAPQPTPTSVPPTSTPSGPQALRGGTLKLVNSPIFRWDYHLHTIVANARDYARIMFNGLLRYDIRTDSPQPDIAQSWSVDSDGNWIFKLRKGVRFHDLEPVNGRVLTAEDVKWNLDRIRGAVEEVSAQAVWSTRFRTIDDVQVVDAETVKLVMNQPDGNMLWSLSFEQMVLYAQEAAIDGFFDDPKTQIGTGPFVKESLIFPGESRFERNDDYWRSEVLGEPIPYVDALTFLDDFVPGNDFSVRFALLSTGQIDFTALNNPDHVNFFNDKNVQITDTLGAFVGTWGIMLNVTKPPFDDIRLRQAVNLTLDRQEFAEGIYGGNAYIVGQIGAKEAWGHWDQEKLASLPGMRGGAGKLEDLDAARALMADAGVPNGFEFTLEAGSPITDEHLIIAEQMARAGITMNISENPGRNVARPTAFAEGKDAVWVNAGGGTTPDQALIQSFHSTAPENSMQWFSPELDSLIDQQASTIDFEQRKILLDELQTFIWDFMPYATRPRFLYFWISWDYVKNRGAPDHTHNFRAAQFDEVWIDRS